MYPWFYDSNDWEVWGFVTEVIIEGQTEAWDFMLLAGYTLHN